MFEKKAALFLYTVSPVHMGAGTALGAIDNPIQRERHTEHPMMVGTGIKGALRHECQDKGPAWVNSIFGPPTESSADHAGAVSFADAQIVLFPARSLRGAYVYTTSPLAIERLRRLLGIAGLDGEANWQLPSLGDDQCAVIKRDELLVDSKHLVLESFRFESVEPQGDLPRLAEWLAKAALPSVKTDQANDTWLKFFHEKIKNHLVLLHDDRFGYFVRRSTVVEPHVRINDASGTADDGGLFYTENLPPESLMVSLLMVSQERRKDGARRPASDIFNDVYNRLNGRTIQIGGDSTTGRGHVVLRFFPGA